MVFWGVVWQNQEFLIENINMFRPFLDRIVVSFDLVLRDDIFLFIILLHMYLLILSIWKNFLQKEWVVDENILL